MVIVLTLPGVKGQGFDSPTVLTLICIERNATMIAQLVRASDMILEDQGLEPPDRFVLLVSQCVLVAQLVRAFALRG